MKHSLALCRLSLTMWLIIATFFVAAAKSSAAPPATDAFDEFAEWARDFAQVPETSRAALESRGVLLAKARRAALKDLIQANPQLALDQQLPDGIRGAMPPHIRQWLETSVNTPGKFDVIASLPMPGQPNPSPVARIATIDQQAFRAFVPADLQYQPSLHNARLRGILLDDVIALEAVRPEPNIAPEPPSPVVGLLRLLLIRVDFSDMPGEPFSQSHGEFVVSDLHNFFSVSSYNRAGVHAVGSGSSVTPVLRMPHPTTSYSNSPAAEYWLLLQDAWAAATAAGYSPTNYDYEVVCFNGYPGWDVCGRGSLGTRNAWVSCPTTGVFAHELGHNFGLWHANLWDPAGTSPIGLGTHVEYGDPFDTMGYAAAGIHQFNTRYKSLLNWLTTAESRTVTSSGTYRIAAHDEYGTGIRALKIVRNPSTNYWVEYRQQFVGNVWAMNGVTIRWAGNGNEATSLLDMTPQSLYGVTDSPLLIGRTFSDSAAGIHITPVAKVTTVPPALDVVVNLGTFPANAAPTLSVTPSVTNVGPGTAITFTASASDPNGDSLALFWDFGDNTFTNGTPSPSHTWTGPGTYLVSCIATDMKGGSRTNTATVVAGYPPTIQNQPMRQTVAFGGTATFSVTASPAPLAYQWNRDGTNLLNATNSTLTLSNVSGLDRGNYSVLVSNPFGSILSTSAPLILGTGVSFTNQAAISIPLSESTAQPYPANLTVSGITQPVIKVTATLHGISHSYPGDLDVLLVNPSGVATYLMGNAGWNYSITNLTLALDDEAPSWLPAFEPFTSTVYRPTNYFLDHSSPLPAPQQPYATDLFALTSGNPNGTWSLYVSDRYQWLDTGSISGWSLQFILVSSNTPPAIIKPPTNVIAYSGDNISFSVSAIGSSPLTYQWRTSGTNIAGATLSTYTLPNVQTNDSGSYSVLVSNTFGSVLTSNAFLTVIHAIPLVEALDAPYLTWTTGGNARWLGTSAGALDFNDVAVSGNIGNFQQSWIETSVTGPGTLNFAWKVSSEPCCDVLRLTVNGNQYDSIGGESGWQMRTVYLPSGPQQLRWTYSKDGSVLAGQDKAWLDIVSFTAGSTPPFITRHPENVHVVQNETAFFFVEANGTPPFSYQWLRNGSPVAAGTNPALIIDNAQPLDADIYTVQVSNEAGTVLSSPAFLAVSPTVFFEDFEPDIDLPLWQSLGGQPIATDYVGSISGVNALWFNGAGSRLAATSPMDVARGGTIRFWLALAAGFDFPWEAVELPEDGVVLEYSLDGSTWSHISSYASSNYLYWNYIELPIPSFACSSHTSFRWRQTSNSGTGTDHWALDDIQVISSPLSLNLLGRAQNAFRFFIAGPRNQSCVLESSPNLIHWTLLGAHDLSNGVLTVDVPLSSGATEFFRARIDD